MAMETGFQVMSTISTVRASILHTQNSFFSKQTLSSFPVCSSSSSSSSSSSRGGLKGNNNTLSLPNSSFSRSSGDSNCRGSRIVSCKAREAINEVAVVTDASWSNLVMGSENPVLVEFWAPWCGPCRMIAPVIDELAKEYAGKIVCLKLNTDESPGVASQYGIRSIPTVLFFKNGEKKDSVIGAVPKSTLTATIEKYL